jgi:phosphohistidine phosphatase
LLKLIPYMSIGANRPLGDTFSVLLTDAPDYGVNCVILVANCSSATRLAQRQRAGISLRRLMEGGLARFVELAGVKTLIILRHSKTEKINPAGDPARELTKPGRRWATEAGREIFEAAGMPDLLVTSNAIRALQTGDLAAEAMQFSGERRVVPEVYGATENELIEVIQKFPENFEKIVLVGHNPGLEELSNSFRGAKATDHLPTAGWMVVELGAATWADAKAGSGKVKASGTPNKE